MIPKTTQSAPAPDKAPVPTTKFVVEQDIYVAEKHYAPGAEVLLTASQAKRLGDLVTPV